MISSLYDGMDVCGTDAVLTNDEEDANHPLAHFYFGA
jgi:hypothetical protein